jgi:protein TonB
LPPLETAIPIEPLEKEPKTEGDWEEITWGVPDIMPCFPGCEQLEGSDHEKKACADQKLLRYIYSNLKYPKEAQDKEIEGMALVSFVINLEGKLEEIEVLRDPGGGTGAEAARIVASMNELEPWTVGKTYKGTPIPIRYNLPIRFKLN